MTVAAGMVEGLLPKALLMALMHATPPGWLYWRVPEAVAASANLVHWSVWNVLHVMGSNWQNDAIWQYAFAQSEQNCATVWSGGVDWVLEQAEATIPKAPAARAKTNRVRMAIPLFIPR